MYAENGEVYLIAVAVFDQKVGAFLNPMFVRTRGEATRAFMDAVRDKESPLAKHPEDYSLHELGRFYQEKGRFVNAEPVGECLVTALACVEQGEFMSGLRKEA